jgi:hypothetical protein
LRHPDAYSICSAPGPYEEEFTEATRRWSPSMGICVARTADYLNWRYKEHPEEKYEMLVARQHNKLCGYVVYHSDAGNCTIDDLFAENDVIRELLLRNVVAVGRGHQVDRVSIPWLAGHPGKQFLERIGFRPRESSPVILLTLPGAARHHIEPTGAAWFLTDGDREC